ncbi:MAG TPA: calcium/sodium antiporter [Mycobacteriales bacterium]|nr:calcium/sodium antiporter [Mycobacteriales bacterium]
MDALTLGTLVAGLVALVGGGELLVRGGSGLARSFGLSPLVVGLTVVAFATSAPEFAVTLDATLSGNPGIAVGNVVGSNVANVLLVLGVSALVLPVAVRSSLVRLDVPVVIVLSVLLLLLSLDGQVSRGDGALLVALLLAYVGWSVLAGRRETAALASSQEGSSNQSEHQRRPVRDGALVLVGVGLLVLGARWLVSAATTIAAAAGVSDLVIGLTVVAIGTSLPELATSVIAALRGEREMAIGNVLGSNVFNIGAVLGLAAVVAPGGVPVEPSAVRFDMPVMVAVAVALLPVVFTGLTIARWEGALFLGYYVVYVGYLLLAAAEHDAVEGFSTAMAFFVLPLTAVTLVVLAVYELGVLRGRRAEREARKERA